VCPRGCEGQVLFVLLEVQEVLEVHVLSGLRGILKEVYTVSYIRHLVVASEGVVLHLHNIHL
jgi:hypothetical protein